MAPLNVNFACALYDRIVPLASGEVPTPGLNVNFIEVQHPRDIFDRMVANKEFDVSELSASEYITRHVAGDRSFVAIPVFASRVFRHSFICVNTNIVKKPDDLNGKRIGVQLYHMSAAVYIRGVLQHEYGIDLSTIEWVQGKMETPGSHGQPSVLPLLKPVNITNNTDPTKSLSDLLESGEIAATIGADIATCLNKVPHVQRLFPNFKDVESDYYKRTGIFPIMHLVAFRREFYEANKFVASALFNALEDSKEIARKRMESLGALRYMLPWLGRDLVEIQETFGGDCWPYGLEENRKTLEAVVQFLYEQNMIERTVPIEELFAPVRRINFRIG